MSEFDAKIMYYLCNVSAQVFCSHFHIRMALSFIPDSTSLRLLPIYHPMGDNQVLGEVF